MSTKLGMLLEHEARWKKKFPDSTPQMYWCAYAYLWRSRSDEFIREEIEKDNL